MSISHSNSVGSSSSTITMATIPAIDLATDLSNGLYEDRDHFQAIFSNDSRFFDTSLHLFKSYYALGYIQSDNEKYKEHHIPIRAAASEGHKHRWRSRLLGLTHSNNHNGILKAFLTPTLLRKNDYSNSIRSDSHTSTNETKNDYRKSPMIVHYLRTSVPTNNIPDDNDSEITITRL